MEIIICILIGYLLGNIQAAYIIGRLFYNIDIREQGSKNAGSANAVVVWGWHIGLITFIVDVSKAAAAIWLVQWLYPGESILPILAGLFAVIGHIYPVIMKLKGGKGVASVIGIMVGVDPMIAIVLAITIVIISFVTNQLFWGEFFGLGSFPVAVYLLGYPIEVIILVSISSILSIYRLKGNFFRTISGEEATVMSEIKKSK